MARRPARWRHRRVASCTVCIVKLENPGHSSKLPPRDRRRDPPTEHQPATPCSVATVRAITPRHHQLVGSGSWAHSMTGRTACITLPADLATGHQGAVHATSAHPHMQAHTHMPSSCSCLLKWPLRRSLSRCSLFRTCFSSLMMRKCTHTYTRSLTHKSAWRDKILTRQTHIQVI